MFKEEYRSEGFDLISFLGFFSWLVLGPTIFATIYVFFGALITGQSFNDYLNGIEPFAAYNYIFMVLSHFIGVVVFIWLYKKVLKQDAWNFKTNWIKYLIVILAGFILLYVSTDVMEIIYNKLGYEGITSQNQQAIINALHGPTKTFVIIYTVILAPVFEEILFRKLFFTVLRKYTKLPVWAIVVIVASVFAFLHVTDLESLVFFPQYFVLALFITGAYAITKENLYVSTGLHFLNNLVAVIDILL